MYTFFGFIPLLSVECGPSSARFPFKNKTKKTSIQQEQEQQTRKRSHTHTHTHARTHARTHTHALNKSAVPDDILLGHPHNLRQSFQAAHDIIKGAKPPAFIRVRAVITLPPTYSMQTIDLLVIPTPSHCPAVTATVPGPSCYMSAAKFCCCKVSVLLSSTHRELICKRRFTVLICKHRFTQLIYKRRFTQLLCKHRFTELICRYSFTELICKWRFTQLIYKHRFTALIFKR